MTTSSILWQTLWVELALFALFILSSPLELLLHFWALMNLARVRDLPGAGLSRQAMLVAGYLLVRGYLLDFVVNTVWMTLYLREWPRELTVTKRLDRHAAAGSGRRYEKCQPIQLLYLKWFDTKHADGIHR